MTTFGWDASNYDDVPTVRDGIDFYTHKAAEGHFTYYDREYKASLNTARALGIPVLGAYFVNHPGSVNDQVDWFVQILDQDTPWWRKHECFILQIDAEKFDYMPSAPTKAEIQAFGDRLVNVHGVSPKRVLAYAPQWLYGNTLTGLSYRLWASAYGGNPVGHYRAVYPGDQDVKRWQSYSGQSPLILQYGSNTTIGNQTTCDANAYRGTLQQLMADLGAGAPAPQEGEEMTVKLINVTKGPLAGQVFKLYPTDLGMAYEPLPEELGPATILWGTEINVENPDHFGTHIDKLRAQWVAMSGNGGGTGPGPVVSFPTYTTSGPIVFTPND